MKMANRENRNNARARVNYKKAIAVLQAGGIG